MVCYGLWDTFVAFKHDHECFYQKLVGKDHQCIMWIRNTSVSNPFSLVYLCTHAHKHTLIHNTHTLIHSTHTHNTHSYTIHTHSYTIHTLIHTHAQTLIHTLTLIHNTHTFIAI